MDMTTDEDGMKQKAETVKAAREYMKNPDLMKRLQPHIDAIKGKAKKMGQKTQLQKLKEKGKKMQEKEDKEEENETPEEESAEGEE